MIMVNPSFNEWIETLAQDENFLVCTALSDRARQERYDLELVTRFLTLRKRPASRLHFDDLGNFLDDEAERFASDKSYNTRKRSECSLPHSDCSQRTMATTFSDDTTAQRSGTSVGS